MEPTRITVQPEICHGKPCIRGMRYSVSLIMELLAAGMSHAKILTDYPALEEADIRACLAYSARLSNPLPETPATPAAGISSVTAYRVGGMVRACLPHGRHEYSSAE